ncbi:MAG: leucyl/phenylalanyl-tRNA--protein transferase [Halobacteriovoraceae bacterium]|nr:leucyl/phenylalanyl-tRNA--protein transferase [Halobacteriovoraceae bacterium]
MAVLKFPPVETADENGLLALGGDLEVPTLILAYRQGIFPWPISDEFPLAWFSPDPRGIIEYEDLKINKRFKRYLQKTNLEFTCNKDFESVIRNCSKVPRNQQSGTWITEEVIQSYLELFKRGMAYSLEAWEGDELVGGIYGVCINGIITGESMFHVLPNTSKFCLCALLILLKAQEINWLDTQMVTPVIKGLGGKEITRSEFLLRLNQAPLKSRKEIFPDLFDKNLFNNIC